MSSSGSGLARTATVAIEVFVGAGAYFGTVALVTDSYAPPHEWLARTGFDSWVLPGVALLLLVAVPMTVAVVLELTRSSHALAASVGAGVVLVGWIVVQLSILGLVHPLQPTMFVCGCLLAVLPFLAHRPVEG